MAMQFSKEDQEKLREMINPRFIVSGQKKRIVRMWKIYRKKENGDILSNII